MQNHPEPIEGTRFAAFSRDELETIQGALAGTVSVIMQAAADPVHEVCRNRDAAEASADMLHTAGTLVMEISDHLEEAHPGPEVLAEIVERVRYMAILDLLPEGGG